MFDLFINQVAKYGNRLVSQKQAKFFAAQAKNLAKVHPLVSEVLEDKLEKSLVVNLWMTDEDRKTNPNWITITVSWGGANGLSLEFVPSEAMYSNLNLDWQGGRLVKL